MTNAKPGPEIYIKAASRLSATPVNAIAMEDSLNGVTAAKRTVMNCVVV
jgi:putative hydrolase of the HAD superfamily